jgi:hypothetical protein
MPLSVRASCLPNRNLAANLAIQIEPWTYYWCCELRNSGGIIWWTLYEDYWVCIICARYVGGAGPNLITFRGVATNLPKNINSSTRYKVPKAIFQNSFWFAAIPEHIPGWAVLFLLVRYTDAGEYFTCFFQSRNMETKNHSRGATRVEKEAMRSASVVRSEPRNHSRPNHRRWL